MPTESGYRVYTEELSRRSRDGPAVPARPDRDAQRARGGAPATTETLSRATHLLALVSAPALEAAAVRHVEVLRSSRGRHRRRDHGLGQRVEARLRVSRSRSTPGSSTGRGVPRRAARSACGSARAPSGGASRTRALRPRSARSSSCVRPAFSDVVADAAPSSTSAAPPGCSAKRAARSSRPAQRLLEVLERRAAVLGLLRRRSTRTGRSSASGRSSRGGAPRRLVRRYDLRPAEPLARRRRPLRAAADGLREGDPLGARRGIRALAPRRRRLRGRADGRMATTEPTTTSCSASSATRATPRSRRRSAGSRASSTRTSAKPGRGAALPRGRRGLRGAVRSRSAGDYDRSATRASATAASPDGRRLRQPRRTSSPRSSARTSSVAARRGARPRGRRSSAPTSRSTSTRPATGLTLDGVRRVAAPCERATERAPRPVRDRRRARPAAAPGRVQQVTRTVLGQFVRTRACPRCDGAGTSSRRRASAARATAACSRTAARARDPGGIHDGQRIRVRGAGHAGLGRRRGRRLCHGARPAARRRSIATATTSRRAG